MVWTALSGAFARRNRGKKKAWRWRREKQRERERQRRQAQYEAEVSCWEEELCMFQWEKLLWGVSELDDCFCIYGEAVRELLLEDKGSLAFLLCGKNTGIYRNLWITGEENGRGKFADDTGQVRYFPDAGKRKNNILTLRRP